ncbi:hypothetical protein LDB30_15765 (plasmid) [Acidithiobacillus ferrooxidans]|nr:hypothetical protein LDB30_15765 [Acidithiobacillus ferrooxidans]
MLQFPTDLPDGGELHSIFGPESTLASCHDPSTGIALGQVGKSCRGYCLKAVIALTCVSPTHFVPKEKDEIFARKLSPFWISENMSFPPRTESTLFVPDKRSSGVSHRQVLKILTLCVLHNLNTCERMLGE